jgi:Xaa-Pro aminopeptidase
VLWRHAIAQRWPSAEIKEAWPILDDVRSIKSASEIAALRRASMTTARAVVAAARAIRPGATQREVEGIAMGAALKAGSDGPSLWPWVRSGPQSSSTVLFDAFMDYENGDRIMRGGEIVRVDLGFDADGYKGDLGRTFPVSGRFTPDQRAALALLNGAYLAGAGVMREGVSRDSVIAASKAYLRAHLPSVGSSVARAAGEQLLNHGSWPLHGLGLDMAEGLPRILRAGNVICFEPAISVGGEDLFVEDTFLITTTGAERLSALLPYEPLALEQLMRGTSHRAP